MTMASKRFVLFLAFFFAGIHLISSVTDPNDAAVLRSLKESWKNTPPSWNKSDDPCGLSWEGVTCNNYRVSALALQGMGLEGELTDVIWGLTELTSLDLSFNPGLTGSLSPRLGDLKKLNILILAGCSLSGEIPDELGNLERLSFLALNSNKLSGAIPPTLGKLSDLVWLDLAENRLSGPLPVSPGLDLLFKAKHFHLYQNQLSGLIPPELFSSEMELIHLLCDGNRFSGPIPITLALVRTLEVVRLDGNALIGKVPENINNLTNVNELNLARNCLTGPLPDLSGMNSLNYVDLSNNSFSPSEAPLWFSTLPTLTTLVLEFGSLRGTVPEKLFSLPQLQQVKLKNNAFNDTLNMGDSISPQLQLVDLQNNQISALTLGYEYKNELLLAGNPLCSGSSANFCQPPHQETKT